MRLGFACCSRNNRSILVLYILRSSTVVFLRS
jgi:hypothetical protein